MYRPHNRLSALLLACLVASGCSGSYELPPTAQPGGPRQNAAAARVAEAGGIPPDGRVVLPGQEARPRPEQPETYRGAEIRPGAPQRLARPGEPMRLSGEGVTLNFVNADAREVAKAVLGDLLGLNYVVDPRVQTTVTVQTSRPLDRAELLPTLEVIFRASALDLSEVQGIYRIQPIDGSRAGRSAETGAVARALGAGGGVHVMALRFASAAELQKLLEPVVPPGLVLRADTTRNQLVIAGPRDELPAIVDLADSFDVDWLAGTSYALYPLQSGVARSLATDLERIFGDVEQGPAAGVVRFLPVERMNAILVISTSPDYLARAQQWIERLDRGGDEDTLGLHVYSVQNSRAADLAAVLAELFSPRDVRAVLPQTSPALVQSEMRTGEAAPSGGGAATAERGAEPRSSASSASASAQQNRQYAAQAPPSRGAGPPAGSSPLLGFDAFGRGGQRDQQVRIVADEKNNALVIYAKPRDYRMIEAAIRRLDVVPQQVMIEATIVEVTLNDNLRYGLQWFFRNGNFDAILTQSATSAVSAINPGFNFTYSGGSARAILSALADVTDLNVVSSPQVLVLDHQTAVLQVGDQVPVPVQQAQSVTDPAAPLVNSIEYRDTGVILRVTPRVNATGQIILEIVQEVSDVVRTTTSDINAPTISQRRIASTVSVQNGDTIGLGGLIRDGTTRSRTGIPILSDIPVLGLLFSERRVEKARTELLVMLTPRAIRNPAEARDITEEMRQRLTNIRARWPR